VAQHKTPQAPRLTRKNFDRKVPDAGRHLLNLGTGEGTLLSTVWLLCPLDDSVRSVLTVFLVTVPWVCQPQMYSGQHLIEKITQLHVFACNLQGFSKPALQHSQASALSVSCCC
jgi:hypothetical protein